MMLVFLFIFAGVTGEVVNGRCRLEPHPSAEYLCKVSDAIEGTRVCGASEPAGTTVIPRCRPNYYSTSSLTFMQCFDNGYWDYIAKCTPECGRITPDGTDLVIGGERVKKGELPWHAGIYTKTTKPYMQICGGSLVSTDVVLSAAHCFYSDGKQLPASQYAVAVGKLYRPWNDKNDEAQKSNVKVIHIPPRYQGASTSYQDDIAVVVVEREFQLKTFIRPVCLSFDYQFETRQLYSGNKGKVAGWGLTAANGKPSPVLLVANLPFVEVGTCIRNSPYEFIEYITSDKICAGSKQPNSALCKGDSGGGLAFPDPVQGIERYYLRGIVSTVPKSVDGNACNTAAYTSFTSIIKHEQFIKQFWSEQGEFKCRDGSYITAASHCDGTRNCPDGSDETLAACSKKTCSSYLFQCAYGACVDRGVICNGVAHCADGSDEADKLCVTLKPGTALAVISEPKPGACELPPYPEHGWYSSNIPGAQPGQRYERVTLTNVTCARGYGMLRPSSAQYYCYNDYWTEELPKCVRMCQLDPLPSVEYLCLDSSTYDGFRVCREYESNGTQARPQCRSNYYSKDPLPFMQCTDGDWDYIAKCTPDCGTVYSSSSSGLGELPWHAVIYTKTTDPYTQICGGSLISNDVVLSAAHCFYLDKQRPASQYAVALGKIIRQWVINDGRQISDVKEIQLPVRFQGRAVHFQNDVAVIKVTDPFVYTAFVRPVCLDFGLKFDEQQLQVGNKGKIALWGFTKTGKPSVILRVVQMPYVDVETCIDNYKTDFLSYTTGDKICAGTLEPEHALCIGDSGSGLAFPTPDRNGTRRYYLRGIASIAPFVDKVCSTTLYAFFTQIQKHEDFIRRFAIDS